MPDALLADFDFYQAHLADWLSNERGKFALIAKSTLLEFLDSEYRCPGDFTE